jgi:hypothetical protein
VGGLTGINNITNQANLYLPVKNIDGTMTTITLEGVYYDPTVKYNLVSVAELASLNFESRFGRRQSLVHGPAGMHVPLIHTCNIYAIDATNNPNQFAFASISINDKRGEGTSILQSYNQRGQAHPSLKERREGPAERVKETSISMHHLPARQNRSQSSSACSHWR